jgi:hypothetical protein
MPRRTTSIRPRLARLVFLSLVAWALVSLGRRARSEPGEAPEPAREPSVPPVTATPPSTRSFATRRLAGTLAFAALFFAGASFSAVAGDTVVGLLESEAEPAQVEAAPVEAPTAESDGAECQTSDDELVSAAHSACPSDEAAEPAPEAAAEPVSVPGAAAPEPAPAAAPEPAPAPAEPEEQPAAVPAAEAEEPQPAHGAGPPEPAAAPAERAPLAAHPKSPPARPRPQPVKPARAVELEPEVSEPGFAATVWLYRALPDPTPPSLRLTPKFASILLGRSRAAGADWALVLGVLRAGGGQAQAPVRPATVAETAARLTEAGPAKDEWSAALTITGRTAMSDRAVALAHYYRAVGINALVHGLRAEQDELTERLLADERVDVYFGGRVDIDARRIDVRVLALIAYLAEKYGQITVSSLVTGHRLYARPGVVSAHVYGHAVDIAALGGTPIAGHQQPGSVTEKAVRDILLLPAEMRPRQVISLIGMGGPSFPLADHGDHIHVGY